MRQTGGGGGSSLFGSGYRYASAGIQNELRLLGVNLPETVILGKAIRTNFGSQVVERDPARQCRARLMDESGGYVCPLWWFAGPKAAETVDIKSGELASLILFIRNDSIPSQYFGYQANSNSDPSPRTSGIPKFDRTMSFFVEVFYSHGSQKLRFPVKVVIGYDGSLRVETQNGSGSF
ncbi:MAG TPA: hypothetical protein VI451_14130 [Anaerolineales bacterium]|nr:hypothetical protein [Anaerolineales bacterium]